MLIMKLKVGAKILLGYAIILVFLGVVAYFGISGLKTVDGDLMQIVDTRVPISLDVWEIRYDILNQASLLRGYLLTDKEDLIKELEKSNAETVQKEEQISKKLTTEQGKKYLQQVVKLDEDYDKNSQIIIKLWKEGKKGEIQEYLNKGSLIIGEFRKTSDELVNYNEKLLEDRSKDAKVTADKEQQNTIVAVVVAIIIGIGIGIYFGRSISKPIVALTAVAGLVAQGDLTHVVPDIKTRDEIETLGKAFKTMVENLTNMVHQISSTSQQVAATSQQLSANAEEATKATQQVAMAIGEVAKGSAEQTKSVTDTVGTVDQVTQAIEQIASGAQEQNRNVMNTTELVEGMSTKIDIMAKGMEAVKGASQQNGVIAEEGGKAVEKTVVGMERVKDAVFESANRIKELGEQSNQIGEIIQVIDDIAEQTNLLALNAAIEAARAGEHGKGFAVVADEVRKLAERSGKATKEIADLITNIQKGTNVAVESMVIGTKEVEEGVIVAREAGKSLDEIVVVVEQSNVGVQKIMEIIEEILAGSQEVSQAISNVAAITEENTAATEEISASAQQVSGAMQNISAITEESSAAAEEVSASTEEMTASTEEIAASADSLAKMAQQLQDLVAQFKI